MTGPRERQKVWTLGDELDKAVICHRFYSSYTANTLPNMFLKGLETLKLEDKWFALWNKHTNFCYWLSKKRCYRALKIDWLKLEDPMEWKWMYRKIKVMRISSEPSPLQIMIDQQQLQNMKYFNYLSCIITSDANVHVKLNPGLPWQKQHSTERRLFTSKLDSNLRNKLVKC